MPFSVEIITPERSLPVVQADHVTLPGHDGQVGIRAGHSPLVVLLGHGNLLIKSASAPDNTFVLRGGVAQVSHNKLQILAEGAVDAAAISETAIFDKLTKLDGATYDDPAALVAAKAEAAWLVTQLKSAGKKPPELKQVG